MLGSGSEDDHTQESEAAFLAFGGIKIPPTRVLELMQVCACLLCMIRLTLTCNYELNSYIVPQPSFLMFLL